VVNNGALVFSHSNTYTFGGAISGSGSVSQTGVGTVVLNGVNSYTGGTAIQRGTLRTGIAGALPAGGAVSIAPPARSTSTASARPSATSAAPRDRASFSATPR